MKNKTAITLATFLAVALANPRKVVQPRQSFCASVPAYMTGNRIVGGEAAPKPIPWQVSVRQGTSGGAHFCGGTILDEKTVMCAAHCFTVGQGMDGVYIAAGITDKYDTTGQIIEVANGVWNPELPYVYETNNGDFVILKLSSALTLNDNVQPACLPPTGYAPESNGPTCIVSGWGDLEFGGSSPTDLQWVGVPLITNEECSKAYNVTDAMICAGLPEGGKDSCQGDSGGPLVCDENGQAILTGVVSFGDGCAAPNKPGVYARVTAVLDWIEANMEGGSGGNPPAPNPTTAAPPAANDCATPSYQGDGTCDDENNTPGCAYDGGDCCGDDVVTTWCSACECLDPAATPSPTPSPTTAAPPPSNGCAVAGYQGDGSCDDQNNTPGCEYDGGDCCGDDVVTTWCIACECLDPAVSPSPTTAAPPPSNGCAIPSYQGDGSCDDYNNTPGCDYDGGDCCGDDVVTTWCSVCECLAP